MIPQDQSRVLDAGLQSLAQFGRETSVRGRFVALYLGIRRMGSVVAQLGSSSATPASDIERFLDEMFTKTHLPEPFLVLTAPFGGSRSPTAPYSSRSGVTAPGHRYPTNTWRNNFAIQKGIGCPAEAAVVHDLLLSPAIRLACPHMAVSPDGQHVCSIANTAYRGEEHSIWLRMTPDGYQVVDVDLPAVYEAYLLPAGARIPVFALIAMLYSFAPSGVYPAREAVGIPDFADDFHFSLDQIATIFDADPESPGNAAVLQAAQVEVVAPIPSATPTPPAGERPRRRPRRPSGELPPEADPIEMNTGIGAERLVAEDLVRHGWHVEYRGNQQRLGYDLEAQRPGQTLCVEVKSSVSFTSPVLTAFEWAAAQQHGEAYVLAVVDFYGSDQQRIWYVRDPAATASTTERSTSLFRLARGSIEPLATEAEFL